MISITRAILTMGLLLGPSTLAAAIEARDDPAPLWFTLKIWSTDLNTKITPTNHVKTDERGSTTGIESYQGDSPEPVFQIPKDQTDKQYIVGQLNFYQMPSVGRQVFITAAPYLDPAQEVTCTVMFTEDPGREDIDWFLRQGAPDKLTIDCSEASIAGK